jgi:hypothetical protein
MKFLEQNWRSKHRPSEKGENQNYFQFCSRTTTLFNQQNYILKILNSDIPHPKKISSGVDNWYLDEFFGESICGRWYIYLEQTIYHLCRLISCWLSTLAVEYHLLWTIISNVAEIFISSRRYSTKADETHMTGMIFI